MISFHSEIERFDEMGEKTGWSYVFIPAALANQLNPGCKKSYRVKGSLDNIAFEGLSLIPMGEGDFILALKGSLRKQLKKEAGAQLSVTLELHQDFKNEMPAEMELCLLEDPAYMQQFQRMPGSYQNYYINWYKSAKTEATKVKRLTMIVDAMARGLDFGQMIREHKR
jgi:hypothetical protein